ncbi:hypothetical protein TCAL_11508 [Tigriopus californicus]|uniref:Protein kinase domain-containing protein n=1 Tax=Tigriopus californicus TaxID=6832 RepID=A0A553N7V7_TIGCA|nr:inhibitor of nuclear factor kappa-B kinase subunit epsilon-like [Tigriopus californicus]XP_059089188.1 inhibitor of nuclear factor kappa-B kinase subunit epsilon-like [Tigriopus californicus]TRY61517.1 hypothetical protein TCAL_11508 [Tigriopus californicus]
MSFLRGSANYVWCTTSVLGKGATGAVFQGVNKHNGETVAVKTFNQLSHMRPQEVQMREFEVLQKVKHENIVKLLAIEEEQEGRGKVIVMELCTGGSLFNLLDDPENNFGLDEDEWVLVLSHLSAGMNHLRDNNLVHRDLKPGNIMKFIKDDGTIVYKLTDFGAARELQDDQQFVSLYGTEEYLHPDMYERAVLRKPVGKTFGATVDLWSIGVTLYHVATGNLPFRPFGGRRNKETMYHITTKKASGVISGVQTSDNGPIQWNKELPSTCLLSAGIKKHITPLLAGLLEVNPEKMWTFDQFFSEVTRILNKKKLHIFYMNKLSELRVYLDKEERLENFQHLLLEQTGVDPAKQLLLFQSNFLTHSVEPVTPGTSYPDTSQNEPIVLFSKENNNITLGIEKEVPSFPALPNLVSVENDATLAKSACAVGYAYRRKIEAYSRCSEVIDKAVKMLVEVISTQLEKLLEISEKCKALTKITESQMSFFNASHLSHLRIIEVFSRNEHESIEDWKKRVDELVRDDLVRFQGYRKQLHDLFPAIEQLNKRYVLEHHLIREWKEVTREINNISPCAIKGKTYVGKLKESWQHLLRDRASRTLTYNDEQFHILEKIKMQETIRILADLLQKECQPVVNQLTEVLADWFKMAQTTFLQTEILHKDITKYEDEIETFSVAVKTSQDRYESLLDEVLTNVKEEQNADFELEKQKMLLLQHITANGNKNPNHDTENHTTNHTNNSNDPGKSKLNENKVQIRRALRSILTTQDEVWGIMNENSRLIEQFGQLAVASSSMDHNSSQILAEIDDTLENYGSH